MLNLNLSLPAHGVDVSNHNGLFNWPAWRGHITFAEIKCTEGLDFRDPLYETNMIETAGLGEFYRFPYHYAHPELDPAEQARYFRDHAKPLMRKTDHFVLDLESTGGLSPVDVSFWAFVFCSELNRLEPAHRCVVQTFPAFAEAGNCAQLHSWHLWVMDWMVPEPRMPIGPWSQWALWQTATGAVDRDQFNGNPTMLRQFCETTGPAPIP